jgi:hypothetical protein
MKDQKGKTKRSQQKYPALNPRVNARVRQDEIDYDYIDKLSPEEKAWLNKFTEEYTNASLILDDDKNIIPEKNLHQTAEHKKQIYDRNNARNRDQYGIIKSKVANTHLFNIERVMNVVEQKLVEGVNPANIENAYVDYLTGLEVDKFLVEYDSAMLSFREDYE